MIENRILEIDRLIPHKRNFRQHPDTQLSQLGASHERFGQFRSVVVVEREQGSYTIVAGHGIVEAMKRNGVQQVRADVLPRDTSDEDVEAILVADNLLPQGASDDNAILAELLQEQMDAGFDLSALGSDEETLRQMVESLGDEYVGTGETGDGEDEAIPEDVPTRSHVGDIWQLGSHRVGIFNCYATEQLKGMIGNEKVQAIVSDPPYGMRLDTSYSFSLGNEAMSIRPTKGYAKIIGDDQAFSSSFFFSTFPAVQEVFLFGADYYVDTLPDYGKGGAWMVWDKKNEALRNVLGLADFELIWSMQRHKRRVYAILWNGALGTESEDTKCRVHPTQKPVRLLEAIMGEYVKPDMLVCDPFLGSGSTLIACEKLGYKCYGTELDPHYGDVILSRWEKITGQTAILVERIEVEKLEPQKEQVK